MRKAPKNIAEHQKSRTESFASVARSFGEANNRYQALAAESLGRAVEIQSQFVGEAYESYIAQAGDDEALMPIFTREEGRHRLNPRASNMRLALPYPRFCDLCHAHDSGNGSGFAGQGTSPLFNGAIFHT